MTTNTDPIIAFCESEWNAWKGDCSGFVKAVARRLEIQLTGQANQIVDYLEVAAAWLNLGADPMMATARANEGYFVVGGMKNQPNGHVVVVVRSAPLKYPVAYWGRLGAVGRKNTPINWSWSSGDLPNVHFFATKK